MLDQHLKLKGISNNTRVLYRYVRKQGLSRSNARWFAIGVVSGLNPDIWRP